MCGRGLLLLLHCCFPAHVAPKLGLHPPCAVDFLRQVREIWLSSEDTGAYGRDIGTSLPDLLEALVQELPTGRDRRLGWWW